MNGFVGSVGAVGAHDFLWKTVLLLSLRSGGWQNGVSTVYSF
jgi:hypothetical protein